MDTNGFSDPYCMISLVAPSLSSEMCVCVRVRVCVFVCVCVYIHIYIIHTYIHTYKVAPSLSSEGENTYSLTNNPWSSSIKSIKSLKGFFKGLLTSSRSEMRPPSAACPHKYSEDDMSTPGSGRQEDGGGHQGDGSDGGDERGHLCVGGGGGESCQEGGFRKVEYSPQCPRGDTGWKRSSLGAPGKECFGFAK